VWRTSDRARGPGGGGRFPRRGVPEEPLVNQARPRKIPYRWRRRTPPGSRQPASFSRTAACGSRTKFSTSWASAAAKTAIPGRQARVAFRRGIDRVRRIALCLCEVGQGKVDSDDGPRRRMAGRSCRPTMPCRSRLQETGSVGRQVSEIDEGLGPSPGPAAEEPVVGPRRRSPGKRAPAGSRPWQSSRPGI